MSFQLGKYINKYCLCRSDKIRQTLFILADYHKKYTVFLISANNPAFISAALYTLPNNIDHYLIQRKLAISQ